MMAPKSPQAVQSHLKTPRAGAVEAVAAIKTNKAKETHPAEAMGKAKGNVSVQIHNTAIPQMMIILPPY